MDVEAEIPPQRFAAARAVEIEGSWFVRLAGDGETVLPRGMLAPLGEPMPTRLEAPTHSIVEHLLGLAHADTEAEAAEILAEHARLFCVPDLCQHGRPIWHSGRQQTHSCPRFDPPDLVPVGPVVDFAVGYVALQRGFHAARLRRPPSKKVLRDLGPLLLSDLLLNAEFAEDRFQQAAFIGVLEAATTALLRDSGVEPSLRWSVGRGPGPVLSTRSTVGVYAVDLMTMVGRDEPPPEYECNVCHAPAPRKRPPRSGEGTYCTNPECQRERVRLNKARQRATTHTVAQP